MLEVDIKFLRGRLPISAKFKLNTMNAGLFGLSGSGKSCLLAMLGGRLKPDEGRILLNKEILFDSRNNINLLGKHPAIALVSHEHQTDPGKTVRDNLLENEHKPAKGRQRFDFSTIVDTFEIGHLLDFRAQHLSGSEKLRVLLAGALLAAPRLLLLDDGLVGLDDNLKTKIYSFLHYAHDNHQIGILLSSSILNEASRLSDLIILMMDGTVLAVDSLPQWVANQPLLEAAGGPGVDNLLPVTVTAHDPAYGCTLATFFGIPLVLPYTPRAIREQRYYVGLRARDIALSTGLLQGLSIQNQIKGRVCAVIPYFDRVLVQVDAGTTLVVEITLRAFANLNIQENSAIYCLIKTHSFYFLTVDRPISPPTRTSRQSQSLPG